MKKEKLASTMIMRMKSSLRIDSTIDSTKALPIVDDQLNEGPSLYRLLRQTNCQIDRLPERKRRSYTCLRVTQSHIDHVQPLSRWSLREAQNRATCRNREMLDAHVFVAPHQEGGRSSGIIVQV
jgi:hypothetical protein